ncbi:glycoside hydrolase family 16 protein [Pseudonocardia sichuanensis]|uniref:Beta-glucanase (GH16 family) n=1 Tax=Pseudonocardia kunmingensis TaxID=630975 RepID=A0A543CYU0_9PSEU|nr:glycoside hydrolase family 16 protein [Pseudonocardia kunmingensis]TQM02249.1 beta-glucanase (GH16 family) [Pseudonocardia kunmingensis]
MSRFPGRLRSVMVCAALLLAAGCAGAPGTAPDGGQDLFQALPAPAPPPTEVPKTAAPSEGSTNGASSVSSSGVDWKPVATDDFDRSSLGRSWDAYNSVGGFGNGYRRPSAISVEDGLLRITARGEVSGGMRHERDQLYGRWEFRARTEKGRGRGAAILLWPETENKDDGELDMMEVPHENRTEAHFVIHFSSENKQAGTKVTGDFSQWHTFAMDWLPDRIVWYVDGVKQFETTDRNVIPKVPMHMTIQLDVGPYREWIPAPDETTPEEVSLEFDWVKIYSAPREARR